MFICLFSFLIFQSIIFITFALLFSLPLSVVVTHTRGHKARLFSLLPLVRFLTCIFFIVSRLPGPCFPRRLASACARLSYPRYYSSSRRSQQFSPFYFLCFANKLESSTRVGFELQRQLLLTLVEPQSRVGDKRLKFQVVSPQDGTSVLKGLILTLIAAFEGTPLF